jgi:thiol-disulfide isomerase/thioredoxin
VVRLHKYHSNLIDPTLYDQQDQQRRPIVTNEIHTKTMEQKQFKAITKHTTSTVTTLQDFHTVIQECQVTNQLLIVHWSASWCRSCQRVAPLLHRTIQQIQIQQRVEHQKQQSNGNSVHHVPTKIRYINIPILYSLSSKQHNLHAMFEIHTVPYCHIYYPKIGLIDEFSLTTSNTNKSTKTTIKSISEFSQLIESYMNGYCPVP